MMRCWHFVITCLALAIPSTPPTLASEAAPLPRGVWTVWDAEKAFRETTPTRERLCINGLWRWQPARGASDTVPDGGWGHFKVPGSWPGITDYLQKDCQTVHPHPSWADEKLGAITAAWYQREITIPKEWAGRRIALAADYVNSLATLFVDGKKAGDIHFPGGELDLTAALRPGAKHVLSLLVTAMPLRGVMMSYSDTNAARQVKGSVARRGLCGDVFLVATPQAERIGDVRVETSVRKSEVTFRISLSSVDQAKTYALRAVCSAGFSPLRPPEGGTTNATVFTSKPFKAADLRDGVLAFTEKWKPERLWDIHTPQNVYVASVSLLDSDGKALDTAFPVRFGFREFWIDGRDFYLNGSRIWLSAVPLDNAQVGAAWASYEGAKESLLRLKSFGINFVYTHNYGCEPGSHLGFEEILRAADDTGMLVALSQPHFGHYDWKAPDADRTNGYARHAAFYARVAGSHPSVVAYSTSHNATGSGQDMNPDLMGATEDAIPRGPWSANNAKLAFRAEAIIKALDPTRIVYHHAGDIGSLHASNFYPNFVPIQEMSDWFETWATKGVKPVFLCEYGAPFTWDWAMYRGWYKGVRAFGSAVVPWDFCLAEWNAQFLGDAAYRISEAEKRNLRWEAAKFRAGDLWHRWDYPHQLGSRDFDERYPILAAYLADNWRAFRTWGVSAISPWEHHIFWKPRPDLNRNQRTELKTDWENLQRPGFSPDYLEDRYERMDLAYERADWVATPAAEAMYRNNMPLLAYIAGKPASFTSKDHNFLPGETIEKQIILINNSRVPATCECSWSFSLPVAVRGARKVSIETGQQARIPLSLPLPKGTPPGAYKLSVTAKFDTGETQSDEFAIHVLPPPPAAKPAAKLALFDPKGETAKLLAAMGVAFETVGGPSPAREARGAEMPRPEAELLIIGKGALSADGPAPDIRRVRDGLKVLVFEQTAEALEKRLGFRVAEYGLRNVFKRLPDHPALAGLEEHHLRDWRGEATLVPPRLTFEPSDKFGGNVVRWCGLEVPRLWRCGNRGNVASVLIEKPHRGDFLPILDGGFSLQYSPLMEYREGNGMLLFCQMDVTGRTEEEPAAARLVRNLLEYAASWKPAQRRTALYAGDPLGKRHLDRAGIAVGSFDASKLSPDQVLVVGAGGGRQLAASRAAVADFLKAGGRLLAVGLDEAEANSFLPQKVSMRRAEHIAAHFAPPPLASPFAGVSSADVHNRDPRELPLVTGGAAALGNGVLAHAGGVVFCQLAPWSFIKAPEDSPSFTVTAEEAVEGKQSALITMGTVPWAQFGQKIEAGQVGKTYTFAVFVKGVGEPVRARLEVERAARPWDRAVRGEDTTIPADKWTELHVTFKVDKPYPEGWQAYIQCVQPESRLRADLFRLYEGAYAPGPGVPGGRNLFANAGFEAGTQPWFFSWRTEQQNLRKTYRRTAFLLSRTLANMGVGGDTPLFAHFSTPVSGLARESVVKNGDFRLDADKDGMPDGWQLSASSKQVACALEDIAPGAPQRCLRIACTDLGEKGGSIMLAQHDVPAKEGQWYILSLRAKASDFKGGPISVALQTTTDWRPVFAYQRFTPTREWQEFTFRVQATATAAAKTRFQIWHSSVGTLWLADIRLAPCDPPDKGRWLAGLYLDQPQEWDDPYRFFRW